MSAAEAIYNDAKSIAYELIGQYGRKVSYQSISEHDEYKPWDAEASDPDPVDLSVVFDVLDKSYVDGTTIVATDTLILLPAQNLSFTPKNNDKIISGDDVYTIIQIEAVQPGDIVIIYEIIGRSR